MNSTTLKWLAIATVALLIVMVAVDRTDKSDTVSGGEYLIPGLKERINDIDAIAVTGSGDAESVNIARVGDGWQVKEKDGFAADVGKLREVLLALADARKLEQKTANPELFAQLGVQGPEAGGGVLIEISGDVSSDDLSDDSSDDSSDELRYAVIIGNVAQSKNRYARMADDKQSWLIDKNPELPPSAAGWLESDLLDIDAARIRSVSIRHDDGETLRLEKTSAEDTSYSVLDIPEGRELSYASVASGIAGVLKGLTLDDVRRADTGEHADQKPDDFRRSDAGVLKSTSVFTTFDGLEISVRRYQDGDLTWISLTANFLPPAVPSASGEETSAEIGEKSAVEEPAAGEDATDKTTEVSTDGPSSEPSAESPVAEAAQSAEQEASTINARHAGWQYRIPDYKANLIARRWNDILKAQDEE